MSCSTENKNNIIKIMINHIQNGHSYNDDKVNHIMEMLVDESSIKTIDDIDLTFIEDNLHLLMYKNDEYIIRNITIDNIDNIDGSVTFGFDYLLKSKEGDKDAKYGKNTATVSYLDRPELLKK